MYKIVNCLRCKKSFSSTFREVCDACYEIEKGCIKKIILFFQENPERTLTVQELSTELDIELSYLEDLFIAGKLSFLDKHVLIKCSACGELISHIPNKMYLCGTCMVKMGANPNKKEVKVYPEVQLKHFDKNIYHSKKTKPNTFKK